MIEFGTGGWRAIIGEGFTKKNVQILTAAIITKLKKDGFADKSFIIGYDRRFLSELSTQWASEVVAGLGIECLIIDRESPTPLIMYAVDRMQLPYGMAITASHNPAIYNGIKVFMGAGRDADEILTSEIEEILKTIEYSKIELVPYCQAIKSGKVKLIDPMNDYIDDILKTTDVIAIRNRNLHVVIDPMFGVGKAALQTIFLTTRCNVDVIHEKHDALFGGRLPAPTKDTLAPLITHVRENFCDIGIATDGDADRLGVIDDKAEFLHPNKVLVLLYYYLLKYKKISGPAVRNIATTHMLDKVAQDFGQVCYEVPVGFKHVSSKMSETGAIIGGESSGGLTVRGHIQGKDGIYAATLLVEMLAVTGCKLSELWKQLEEKYGKHEMIEVEYSFSQDKKEAILETLMQEKQLPMFPYKVEKVSYLDGCKVYFQNGGWIIARFSGTEPLLRIFCEMENQQSAKKICMIMEEFLEL